MKVVQGLSVSLTTGVVRKFCKNKNTLTNIESIPRITNFGRVHTANVKKYVIGPCRQVCGLRFTVCTRA